MLQDVCACLRITDAVFKKKKKSTSLPRELSAIADLNPPQISQCCEQLLTCCGCRYKAGTYFFFFCFSGTKIREAQQSALGPFWMHTVQGFYRNGTQAESPCQHSLTSESYYRTGRAGLTYMIIATMNDYFLFFLPCLWCCWVKILCRTFLFLVFSTINI